MKLYGKGANIFPSTDKIKQKTNIYNLIDALLLIFSQRLSGYLSNTLINLVVYLLIQVLAVKSSLMKSMLGYQMLAG